MMYFRQISALFNTKYNQPRSSKAANVSMFTVFFLYHMSLLKVGLAFYIPCYNTNVKVGTTTDV